MRELGGKGKPPPYYIAYEVHDRNDVTVAASYGALVQSSVAPRAHPRHRRSRRRLQAGLDAHDPFERLRLLVGERRRPPGGAAAVGRCVGAARRRLARDRPALQRGGRAAGEDQDPAHAEGRGRGSRRTTSRARSRRATSGAPATLAIDVPAWEQRIRAALGALSRAGGHPGLGRDAAGSQPDALAGQLRRAVVADRPQLRARLSGSERARRRRHGAGTLRDASTPRRSTGWAATPRWRRRPTRSSPTCATLRKAPLVRSVHRSGDPRGARGRRVLPRDLRPPGRGAPPEERGGGADVRQEGRRADHAGVRVGLRRPDAVAARARSISTATTGSTTKAWSAQRATLVVGRRAARASCSAARRRAASRNRTATAGGRKGGRSCRARATWWSSRSASFRSSELRRAAARRGEAPGEAVRAVVPRHLGRLHQHPARRAAGVQGAADPGLPRVGRRPSRRARARRRPRRHAAGGAVADHRRLGRLPDVQRLLRRRVGLRAGVGHQPEPARAADRGRAARQGQRQAAAAAGAGAGAQQAPRAREGRATP